MAADRECPSQFAGQPWSVWTEHIGRDSPISDEEDVDRKPQAGAMRLPREDMGIFGHCPERDPFYTVVCEFCNTVVKPQGLRNHMDLRHKTAPLESALGLEQPEKTVKCAVVPKTVTSGKSSPGRVKVKVKKPPNGASNVPLERLSVSNQVIPRGFYLLTGGGCLPTEAIVTLTKGREKILLQPDNAHMELNQSSATGPVAHQVSAVDGNGVHLSSPVNGSVDTMPVADLASLPTPSLSPDGQINGVQNSSSDPQSPSYSASDPPLPPLLDLAIDSFEAPVLMPSLSSKSPLPTFKSTSQLNRPSEEHTTLEFVPKAIPWLRGPPKPVTVCSFSSRKLGGVEANNRRVELFYHGLKTALTQGCIRIPTLYSVQQRKRFLLFDSSHW